MEGREGGGGTWGRASGTSLVDPTEESSGEESSRPDRSDSGVSTTQTDTRSCAGTGGDQRS